MTRLEANKKILALVAAKVEKYPALRFCQLLYALNINVPMDFYTESTETLQKAKEAFDND